MELDETLAGGAARETLEEACATVDISHQFASVDVIDAGQVHIFFCGQLVGGFGVGEESLDTALFSEDEIPWDDLAFHSGRFALKKYFEDLRIGETLITHRRTVTEADIVNFGCISGDHFYAHFDEIAARESFFGKRVAHGYFVISAAAGMFVDPSPGPVIANYGLENLRFIEPVAPGDTIGVKLTVKQKVKKAPRGDEKPNGVVVWAIEVRNQHGTPVAVYDSMTLVARRED